MLENTTQPFKTLLAFLRGPLITTNKHVRPGSRQHCQATTCACFVTIGMIPFDCMRLASGTSQTEPQTNVTPVVVNAVLHGSQLLR
jgi:hypothetical protein